jgi:hypothetical protein
MSLKQIFNPTQPNRAKEKEGAPELRSTLMVSSYGM